MTHAKIIEPQPPVSVEDRLEEIARGVEAILATAIVNIGERFAEARDLFRYNRRPGGFTGWVEKRRKINYDTALRMIQVYSTLGESPAQVRDFDQLPASVLYALAAPSPRRPCATRLRSS